jgi:hypothetical protein
MNQRVPLFGFQKLRDIRRADLHFQSRSHAIKRFHTLAGQILPVLVQIDESGRNYKPGRMNDTRPMKWRIRNVDNPAILDTNIANRIQLGLRIDNPPTFDHGVILLR